MKTKFLSLFAGLLLLACNAQTAEGIETIAPTAFAEKINQTVKPQLLDVRTPQEYNIQHLDKAVNVDWNGDGFEAKASKLDKSKPVFVYCLAGGRSRKAAEKLHELGFTQVYDMQGGITKWNAAGLSPDNGKIIGMCSQEYGELLNTDKIVLVDFYAEWCGPCKKMAPYLLKMKEELKDRVTVVRLNADENPTLMKEMKIEELPAVFVYKDKKLAWQHTGYISEDELKKQL